MWLQGTDFGCSDNYKMELCLQVNFLERIRISQHFPGSQYEQLERGRTPGLATRGRSRERNAPGSAREHLRAEGPPGQARCSEDSGSTSPGPPAFPSGSAEVKFTEWNHPFERSDSVAFSTFSVLWDHHLSLVPERLHLPHWTTTKRLLPPIPEPGSPQSALCLCGLPAPGASY